MSFTRATAAPKIEYLDSPPVGWFVLDIRREKRNRDWVALMIDVDPDAFISGAAFPTAPLCLVRIPGAHKRRDAAWDALQDMMATRP